MTTTPALGTLALIKWLGVPFSGFTPIMSDEISYYLQIKAFVYHGFSGGYFTISEHPAPAQFSHFGVHGPMFPVLYGALGKLVGWQFYSAPLFNLIFVTLAIGIYCLLIRPTVLQAFLGTAFLATFLPFYLMLMSVMQDPAHWAIAILIAAGFAGMLRGLWWARRWLFRCTFLALLVYASLMRISWAMFLVPYAMLLVQKPTPRKLFLAAFLGLFGLGTLVFCFRLLCAPFVGVPGAFLMNKIAAGESSPQNIFDHALKNLELLSGMLWDQTPVPGKVIYLEALSFGFITALYAVSSLALLRRQGRRRHDPAVTECWFYAFSIWGLFAGIILFYLIYNNGGWRMLATHLLVCGLVAITSTRTWLKTAVIAFTLVSGGALPWSARSFEASNLPHFAYGPAIRRWAAGMDRLMPYQEGADPWYNTVLADRYPIEFLALPAGIGVSYYWGQPEKLMLPIKSRYVLAEVKAQADPRSLAECVRASAVPVSRESVASRSQRQQNVVARFPVLHDGIVEGRFSAVLYLQQLGRRPTPRVRSTPGQGSAP